MFVDTGVQLEARPRDNNENILDGSSIRSRFREFIRNFRSNNVFHYRDAIVRQWNRRSYFIEVDLAHVKEFDEELLNNILVTITLTIHYLTLSYH